MKLPRDVSGRALALALERVGYRITRQSGSHLRLTCEEPDVHQLTSPAHDPLKVGTLAAILGDAAAHLGLTRDELLRRLSL